MKILTYCISYLILSFYSLSVYADEKKITEESKQIAGDKSSFKIKDYSSLHEVDRTLLIDYVPLKLDGEVKPSSTIHLTLNKTIQMALESNPKLLSVQESLRVSEDSQAISFSTLFPSLDYTYSSTHYRHASQNASYSSGFTLTQSLFTGFSLYTRWQVAKLETEESRNTLKREQQQLIFQVHAAWYALLSAVQFKEEAEDSLNRVKDVHRMSQRFFEEGMVPVTGPLDSKVKVARAKQDVLSKRSQLQKKISDLLTLLDLPQTTQLHIKGKFSGSSKVSSYFEAVESALKERPDFQNMYLAEKRAKDSITLAQSGYWPTVSGSLSYSESADNFSFKESTDNKSATVSVTWNLWESGSTMLSVRRARHLFQKEQYLTQEKRNQIEKEVEAAWVEVQTQEKELLILGQSLETAQENYRAYLIQFEEQTATAKNVLDAQDLLTSTVDSYVRSLASYHTAVARLKLSMGRS
jgi:outer membrane protein